MTSSHKKTQNTNTPLGGTVSAGFYNGDGGRCLLQMSQQIGDGVGEEEIGEQISDNDRHNDMYHPIMHMPQLESYGYDPAWAGSAHAGYMAHIYDYR